MTKKLLKIVSFALVSFLLAICILIFLLFFLSEMPDRATRSWQDVTIIGIAEFRVPAE